MSDTQKVSREMVEELKRWHGGGWVESEPLPADWYYHSVFALATAVLDAAPALRDAVARANETGHDTTKIRSLLSLIAPTTDPPEEDA